MTEEIDWGEAEGLGKAWWDEAATVCHCTEQQKIFALHRWKGMTMVGAARAAKYGATDGATLRQAGHRAAHSSGVMGLMAMAKAQTGKGEDGNVDMDEARSILSRLSRGSDPMVRIRAIETICKIDREEREFNLKQQDAGTFRDEIEAIAKISVELAKSYAMEKGIDWSPPEGATDEH